MGGELGASFDFWNFVNIKDVSQTGRTAVCTAAVQHLQQTDELPWPATITLPPAVTGALYIYIYMYIYIYIYMYIYLQRCTQNDELHTECSSEFKTFERESVSRSVVFDSLRLQGL